MYILQALSIMRKKVKEKAPVLPSRKQFPWFLLREEMLSTEPPELNRSPMRNDHK
jgi:hypothetical protein